MTDDDDLALAVKLLRLAAGTENEHEASSAAIKAATIIRKADLRLTRRVDEEPVRCVLCAPAHEVGVCSQCGYQGPGPGHACTNRKEGEVCERHRTWPVARAWATPPNPFLQAYRYDGSPFAPVPGPSMGYGAIDITTIVIENQSLRAAVATLRTENATLRAELDATNAKKRKRRALPWRTKEKKVSE